MNKIYIIDENYTLRDVYLMWLISLNPRQMLEENNLSYQHMIAFRKIEYITWGQFCDARSRS